MIKATILFILVLITVAYSMDPGAVKPWREAASHVGEIVAQVVKNTGENANKAIRDEVRKDR